GLQKWPNRLTLPTSNCGTPSLARYFHIWRATTGGHMKRIMMLCLALLAGGAISAKAQTSVGVRLGFGAPGFAGFVTVGQPWYWYGGERVYYVRRYVYGQPRYFYDSRFVPGGWRDHDRAFFERRDCDR